MGSNHGSVVYWMTGSVHVPHRRPDTVWRAAWLREDLVLGPPTGSLSDPHPGRV
jgi:hypothetical protein